jgi:hypothetical protein
MQQELQQIQNEKADYLIADLVRNSAGKIITGSRLVLQDPYLKQMAARYGTTAIPTLVEMLEDEKRDWAAILLLYHITQEDPGVLEFFSYEQIADWRTWQRMRELNWWNSYPDSKTYCCIDTFEYRFRVKNSRLQPVDKHIYVGMPPADFKTETLTYRKLIFGESRSNVVGLVRQDSSALWYIDVNLFNQMPTSTEYPLLYFNKPVNETWKVDIGWSYFEGVEISLTDIENRDGDTVYIYKVAVQEGHTNPGDKLTGIRYSKQRGFLELEITNHWVAMPVNKIGQPK